MLFSFAVLSRGLMVKCSKLFAKCDGYIIYFRIHTVQHIYTFRILGDGHAVLFYSGTEIENSETLTYMILYEHFECIINMYGTFWIYIFD